MFFVFACYEHFVKMESLRCMAFYFWLYFATLFSRVYSLLAKSSNSFNFRPRSGSLSGLPSHHWRSGLPSHRWRSLQLLRFSESSFFLLAALRTLSVRTVFSPCLGSYLRNVDGPVCFPPLLAFPLLLGYLCFFFGFFSSCILH